MRRSLGIIALTLVLVTAGATPVLASNPSDPVVDTQRNQTLRAVYFPFLTLGHGLLLIAKYGIGYPVYYAFKPVYDLIYESSEDPHEIDGSHSGSGS